MVLRNNKNQKGPDGQPIAPAPIKPQSAKKNKAQKELSQDSVGNLVLIEQKREIDRLYFDMKIKKRAFEEAFNAWDAERKKDISYWTPVVSDNEEN